MTYVPHAVYALALFLLVRLVLPLLGLALKTEDVVLLAACVVVVGLAMDVVDELREEP